MPAAGRLTLDMGLPPFVSWRPVGAAYFIGLLLALLFATGQPSPAVDVPPADAPSWLPPVGEVATLTQAGGRLGNSFVGCTAAYYEPFYSVKICNDYSGAFSDPYFGAYGAVIFFGGGHAATNDNSVMALVLGRDACVFHRMTEPSPIFGGDSSYATRHANSTTSSDAFIDTTRCEYRVDGQPCAPHSYGSGDIIGPEDGGAANGSLVRVITGGCGVGGVPAVIAAHQVDFPTATGYADGGAPSYAWRRVTDTIIGPSNSAQPNMWSAFVPAQNRIYYEARAAAAQLPPRWFDRATNTYVTGTGAARANDSDTPDGGTMFLVPERHLLVFLDRRLGSMRVQVMDVAAAQPSWTAGGPLSTPLAVSLGWSCGCWCADNQRIIVGGIAGDNAAAYELEIPALLGDSWPVSRAAFGAGQTITFADSCSYKKWSYNPKVRAIVYMPYAATDGADVVYVYRPRGTGTVTTGGTPGGGGAGSGSGSGGGGGGGRCGVGGAVAMALGSLLALHQRRRLPALTWEDIHHRGEHPARAAGEPPQWGGERSAGEREARAGHREHKAVEVSAL